MGPDHLKDNSRCLVALAIVELIWNAFHAGTQSLCEPV
jgi:hypothetical protein